MDKTDKIYVAGHRGLVGSAIVRALRNEGYTNVLCRTHVELNLANQQRVNDFFAKEKPAYVFLAAAKVGGIHANNVYRGEFIYQNLIIQANVIEAARLAGVKRLLFLGSSCIYPRECPQPMKEEYLLTGPLEQTNEPYAVAKIAGIKQCESYNRQYGTDFATVMPTNLYGPNDNFDLQNSHVLPALIRKVHEAKMSGAKQVVVWGTGAPKREFLHVDDMASACLFMMKKTGYTEMVNIGSGQEVSIKELITLVCEAVGYTGEIVYDASKPDGTMRKLLDTSRLENLGWRAQINLRMGISHTYQWFCESMGVSA
ncbi:GDP-fucose synthetase [Gammaproteobacteria bacterium SCGC AG-212-F23]|nr:GDP-fucose synthetase [Gammaproteobacteria bacterium SCGC AG-212-F23]